MKTDVTIQIITGSERERRELHIDPQRLYEFAGDSIETFLSPPSSETATKEQRRMAQAMKTTVKGALLMFGDKLLTLIYGTSDHERPGKKDDVIKWYSLAFAKVLIAQATQGELVLYGGSAVGQIIYIDEIRSISAPDTSLEDYTGVTAAPA